jgi:hypothetical protein
VRHGKVRISGTLQHFGVSPKCWCLSPPIKMRMLVIAALSVPWQYPAVGFGSPATRAALEHVSVMQ